MPTRLQFQRFAIRDINAISTVWQFRHVLGNDILSQFRRFNNFDV